MSVLLAVASTGLTAILMHPLRSLVTVGCLVAVLLPYLACLGLSRGLAREAEISVRSGADLYVTARRYGRPVPIPVAAADEIRRMPGVVKVVPRIVGGIVLGKGDDSAVLVGMPREDFPDAVRCVEGRLPEGTRFNELVVGTDLARRLRLEVGSLIPPFYHNAQGERVSRVVGVFASDVGVWQANLVFTTFESASHIFDQKGTATDLLVWCRPGYQEQLGRALLTLRLPGEGGQARPHVAAREEAEATLRDGATYREGVFHMLWLLAFVVAALVVLVTSGVGLAERRREIGILKATGWQTDQILLRAAVESFLLALSGASVAVILAFVWMKAFNGFGIAAVLLAGADMAPGFRVPFRLGGVPVLLSFLLGLIVVMSGGLYSSWRAATVAPGEAMR